MIRHDSIIGPRNRLRLFFLSTVGLTLAGCGATGPGMAQVTGKVTYQGKPVPKGTVSFVPTAPGGRNATGQIVESGEYRLQTENPGDGALTGDYNVSISARDNAVLDYIPKKPIPPKYLAPAKYENPTTSGLKATVKSGSNTVDFDLAD